MEETASRPCIGTVRSRKPPEMSMGSGPWVVDTPQIFEDIRSHIVGNCIALDMEAYAVAMAAGQMNVPWIIAKSVQDYANGEKSKILARRAAPEIARKAISRFAPPHSRSFSSFFMIHSDLLPEDRPDVTSLLSILGSR